MKIELDLLKRTFDIDNIDSDERAFFAKIIEKLTKNEIPFIMRMVDDDDNCSRDIYFYSGL